jgi:hypothetical protein
MNSRSPGGAVALVAVLAALPSASAERQDPATIPEGEYVTVRDGHLSLRGERVRFWGSQGVKAGRTRADSEAVVERVKSLGFNLIRYWGRFPKPVEYEPGDGSKADREDHFLHCLKRNGFRVWFAGLNGVDRAMPDDVDVVDDPPTAEAWRDAVGPEGMKLHNNPARIWDPRLEAVAIRQMKRIAGHFSRYTGLRWADDPLFCVWELSNEEWWFTRMMGAGYYWRRSAKSKFDEVPSFFQAELLEMWAGFLERKYRDERSLREAWLGLLPGESLEEGKVLLLPFRARIMPDEQLEVLGLEHVLPLRREFGPAEFNGARAGDVIEFLLGLWIAHKRREAEALEPLGRSTRLSPFVWDTGIGFEMAAQYLQQHADAVAHCAYQRGFTHDHGHRRFPWQSGLEGPPQLHWGEPWLEHNHAPGKPFFCYENQMEQPAKYRTEYPMRLVSLGSIQDWDIINWHYFGPTPDSTEDEPYARALDYTTSEHPHPQGLHFQYDEAQMSAMRAAAEAFKHRLLAPAPEPTLFVFGRRSLYDIRMTKYGEAGRRLMPTTYRHGVRILIDSEREEDEIAGPTVPGRSYQPNPVRPTDEIEYDWQRGHLRFDAPGVAVYSGFFAQHGGPVEFRNGVVLREVGVANPPGMPYPVGEDERYVTFSLVSADGRPLAEAAKAVLSAVSTSFNSGFELDHSKMVRPLLWGWNKGATLSRGGLPVLVARVACTVEMPMLDRARYRMLDWHLREVGSGAVEGGILRVPSDRPVFLIELER